MKRENLNDNDYGTAETCSHNHSVGCSGAGSQRSTRNIAALAAMFFLFLGNIGNVQAQAFNIDQARNGSAASPESPINWSNGNLTPTQAHFVEGYSVPYRAIVTGLTPGVPITIRIGYDTKHSGKNALDYLTSYDRLTTTTLSHSSIFGHTAEVIDPLEGVTGVCAQTDQILITAPNSIVLASNLPAGSSQPLTSYNSLTTAEKQMSIFGGTFVDGSFAYVSQDPIGTGDAQSETIVEVTFIPQCSTVVIAWGGHIASRLDWGYTDGVPNSAGGISGSPYHMRLIEYEIGGIVTSLGNQDRSLKASAVAAPPPVCQVIPNMLDVCVGQNAQFVASATSGIPPYTFAWYKAGNYATVISTSQTLTINNAQASDDAEYQVIVTDDFGLTDTCHADLTVNPLPVCSIGNISPATLICNGGNYTITTPLSNSTYAFNWDMTVDGSPSGWAIVGSDTLQTITFSAGDCGSLGFQVHFTLNVTNRATGCQSSCTVDLSPRAPQCAVSIRPPVVLNCSTTSQYLLASYNTEIINPTLEWKRNGVAIGAGISDGVSLDSIQISLPGTYRFTVTDPANSSNTCFAEVTVLQDTAKPVLSETHTNVSCNGLSDGAIDLSVSGGLAPFGYAWSNGAVTQDISGLAAGNYEVIVTGANGCMDSLTVNISQPADLAIIETHTNVACNGGNDGAINITVSGGTPAYSYAWSNGAITEDVSGLAAGSYEVVVTDANACMDSLTVNISQAADLAIIETHTNVACNGGNDGAIDITVSGGTPAYSYAWSNGAITEDVSGLAAGSYEVVVTDANACMDSLTVNISQAADLSIIETHTNVACNGGNDGAIDITVSGGTPAYSYAWSNGAITEDVSGLAAGSYEVVVTDANACMDSLTVTITEATDLAIIETHTNVACNGGNDGAINITVSGGTPAYSYAWSNGAITEDVSGLAAGSYEVVVTDANSCMDSLTVNISEPNDLAIIETHTNVTCNAGNDGAIDITVTGGTPAFTYDWSNGAITQDISGLVAGAYEVIVTDANNCMDSLTITITEPADVSCLINTPSVNPACGSTGNALSSNASGATIYDWSVTGTGWSITSGDGTASIVYTAGSGSGMFKLVVENANGCKDSCTITINCVENDEFCSLTQGFYGNAKGVACATGERGYDLIYRLLASPLIIGKSGQMLTITQADVQCVIKRLPAGGTPAMLPSGNHVFSSNCASGIPLDKKGKFNNVLLGQTITLGLNMRLDPDLGSLVLAGTIMTTVDALPGVDGICGTEDDIADTIVTVRYIPQEVIDALISIYGTANVANLFDLANRALGGQSTGGATLSQINQAVSAINEGFDHCKFLQGFTSSVVALQQQTEMEVDAVNEIQYSAYPNPLKETTTIEFVSQADAAVTVEVFNVEGQRVASLYRGNVTGGDIKRVVFDTGNLPNGIYIYKINSDGVIYSSKLMLMR